jgi:hypothetical protein
MQALGSYMATMASQLQHGLSNIAYWHQLQQCFDFRIFCYINSMDFHCAAHALEFAPLHGIAAFRPLHHGVHRTSSVLVACRHV